MSIKSSFILIAITFFVLTFTWQVFATDELQPPPAAGLRGKNGAAGQDGRPGLSGQSSAGSAAAENSEMHKLAKRYNPQKYGTIGWLAMHGGGGYGGGYGCPGINYKYTN